MIVEQTCLDLRISAIRVEKECVCKTVLFYEIHCYGNGANFATFDVFGRLLLNT